MQIIEAIIQSLIVIVKIVAGFLGEKESLLRVVRVPTLYITYICTFVDFLFIFWQTKIKKTPS